VCTIIQFASGFRARILSSSSLVGYVLEQSIAAHDKNQELRYGYSLIPMVLIVNVVLRHDVLLPNEIVHGGHELQKFIQPLTRQLSPHRVRRGCA
jgi:hypothetical protein